MIINYFLFLLLYYYQGENIIKTNFYPKKDFKKIEFYKTYILADIEIEGKTKYNKKQILEFSKLKLGDKIQIPNKKYLFRIKKLLNTNIFNNIYIYINYIYKNKIYLKISLEDFPILNSLKLIGIQKNEFHKITKNFNIKIGMIINKKIINKIENNIKKYFHEKGYPDVIIYFNIYNDKYKNNILTINVNKGNTVKINKIFFEGNNHLTSSELYSIMKNTKKFNLLNTIFNNSIYISSKYIEDCNSIINKYKSLGFRDAKIVSDTIIRDSKNNLIIKIKINEGKQFFIGKINFLGNKIFSNHFLEKLLNVKYGDIYSLVTIKKNILDAKNNNSIISKYLDNGYLFISLNIIEKSIIDNIVNIEIRISEGEKFIFNKIYYSGNNITKDHIIIPNIKTHCGEIFSKKSIYNTIFNFSKLEFFESKKITFDIKPNLSSHYVNIRWRLFEKNSNNIQFQGGYGYGRIIGNISLNIGNFSIIDIFNLKKWSPFPQGDGEKISFFAQIGSNFRSYGFLFIKPYIKYTSFNFGLNNSRTILDNNYHNLKNQGFLNSIGIYLGINKKFKFKYSDLNLELRSNYDIYNRVKNNLGIKYLSKKGILNDLNYTISLQHISSGPDIVFPRNGSEFDLSCILTFPYSIIFKKRLNLYKNYYWPEYLKFKIKFFLYKEILTNIVTKIGFEFGILDSYNSKLKIIPFHRFYLGGTGIYSSQFIGNEYIPLRGYYIDDIHYLKNDIGGVVYNRMFIEFRYPIIFNEIMKTWILCFLEAGNTTKKYNNYNIFNLKKSIGTGIRVYMSTFGFLGFDLAYGFDNIIKKHQSKWKTHFIIGSEI